MRNGATNRISNNSNASCNNTKNENEIQFGLKGEAYGLFLLFSSPVILYSLDTIVEIGNWHRFSNSACAELKVGCQRVNKSVSRLVLYKTCFLRLEGNPIAWTVQRLRKEIFKSKHFEAFLLKS